MRFCFKPILASLAIVMLLAVAGCGGDAEETSAAPAAIGGSEGETTAPDLSATSQPAVDRLHPVVVLETTLGDITLELDAEKAPLTVDNFLSYVSHGHYDQTIFHQVIQDLPKVILSGAFTSELIEKKADAPIYNEAHNGLKNVRGTIAMARQADAQDSATCHFFLNLSDNDVLDHKDRTAEGYGYCVFGKITEGLNVADKIGAVEVQDTEQFERIPVETVMIKSIRKIK